MPIIRIILGIRENEPEFANRSWVLKMWLQNDEKVVVNQPQNNAPSIYPSLREK